MPSAFIDLCHTQTKQIISAVLALTRQNENDNIHDALLTSNQLLLPMNDKEQMQLVKNVAIVVRDFLQTLDYAPRPVKELVNNS